MDSFGNKPTEMVALGRPFDLGMFYDCRSDTLIPGITLWDKEKLDKDMSVKPKPNTEFKIVASESISDKSSSLGVEASLKASFLSGLVNVEGSAKYLNNKKSSTKQARVTLHYKTTTVFKALTMDQLGTGNLKHCEVIDKGLATHVVTGILYGAQAFFVFDRETSEDESVQNIQGNLKVMIEKIPMIKIDGNGALKMEDKEREKMNNFSCTFHGDFRLEKSPTTFEESVKVYQDLPKLLGPNGENAVPVIVYLLPLSVLDSKASKLVRQISLRLVTEAENVLEGFTDLDMKCNDILNSSAGQNFSYISKKISNFKALCSEFKLGLQGTLAQKLPSIRGGGEEETALAEVLKKAAESPFNSDSLNQWMEEKAKEVNTIKILTKLMKNTEMVSSENAVINKVCDSENALVFVLTSLDSNEPYLSELQQYLKTSQYDRSDAPEPRRWYSSKDVINSVRCKAKAFGDFVEANKDRDKKSIQFLAVALTDKNHEGSTIYLYEDGFRDNENFEFPSKPEALTVGEVTHSSVSLHFKAPSEGVQSITGYRVEFCEEGQEEWKHQLKAEAGEVSITGLSPNTEYSVRVRAVTAVGVGPAAALQSFIRTSTQCAPPEELTLTAVILDLDLTRLKKKFLIKEVPKEIIVGENVLSNLQTMVAETILQMFEEIKKTEEYIKNHEAEIETNDKFEIEIITNVKSKKVDISGTGMFAINCKKCKHTCHFPCSCPRGDDDETDCIAKDLDGDCTVCDCDWSKHNSQKYRWDLELVKKKMTVKKFITTEDINIEDKTVVQALLEELQGGYQSLEETFDELIEKSTSVLNKLWMLIMKPKPLSEADYINTLIEAEKELAKPGWERRVEMLTAQKNRVEENTDSESECSSTNEDDSDSPNEDDSGSPNEDDSDSPNEDDSDSPNEDDSYSPNEDDSD